MRKKVIAGNWKMHKTPAEAKTFIENLIPLVKDHTRDEILIFPSPTSLPATVEAAAGTNICIGSQTVHWLDEGAYTGQTSPRMLNAIGATHVLLGHSEPRIYDSETDERVNLKLKAALRHGLKSIVCIGEKLEERQDGLTIDVLLAQLSGGLAGITSEDAKNFVIAYEPVWAIGTGHTATPDQAEEAHAAIRNKLALHLGDETANAMRILYGGSVKPDNISNLMAMPNIDGALCGGSSLVVDDFARLIHYKAN